MFTENLCIFTFFTKEKQMSIGDFDGNCEKQSIFWIGLGIFHDGTKDVSSCLLSHLL